MNDSLKEQINRLKNEIESLRPLDKETEGRIQQKFRLDWNYHSNNIEGNSLTFGETKTFLLHGITAAGKPLKDHLDVKGHNDALLLLEDIVKDERPLNETFVRELHKLILHEPYEKQAITPDGQKTSRKIEVGKYKTQPNHVITKTGETFYFAKPEETPALMNDLMDWYNTSIMERKLHPVELAALLHYKFIRIHPFDDGNGRLSRILMNLTLMKFSFPPVIIKTQKKEEYYRALQQADGGDSDFFVDYIANLQLDSLALYLRGAKGENIEEDDDFDKEIALFKQKLSSNHDKTNLNSIENRYEDSIKPFLTILNSQFQKFFELFDTIQIYKSVGFTSYALSNFESIIDSLAELIKGTEKLREVTINYNFVNLKNQDDSTRTSIRIRLLFKSENYQIEITSSNLSKKINHTLSYNSPIEKMEQSNLIKDAVKLLMELIEGINK